MNKIELPSFPIIIDKQIHDYVCTSIERESLLASTRCFPHPGRKLQVCSIEYQQYVVKVNIDLENSTHYEMCTFITDKIMTYREAEYFISTLNSYEIEYLTFHNKYTIPMI